MTGSAGEPFARPRVLLTGDASARPGGLERALTRAGLHIEETAPGPGGIPPDALLTTLPAADPEQLRRLLADAALDPPRIIVFAAEDRDAPVTALDLGAADALAAPIHLPDLCARIAARVRDRQAPVRTPHEARVRNSLRDLGEEARTMLQPEEIALALVRRLGRALDLARCALVLVGPGEDEGKIVAETGGVRGERSRLDLTRYPEIGDAVRSRRTLAATDTAFPEAGAPMTVLPVVVEDAVAAVLLLHGHGSAPKLSASQLGLAAHLGEAAARALESQGQARRPHDLSPAPLDRRLEEELERARRYSLGFSLVLMNVDPAVENGPRDDQAVGRRRHETAGRLRRELRLPDFVSNYGADDFAAVLPETGADGARRTVIRIRERVGGISAGIVAYPHPAVTAPDDLFALVEAALRRGQAQSGERIGIAE
jgi:GGDEF domain-containing protein